MTEKRKFLAVADWEKLQYHKQLRNPPWTRLHREWLHDYRFSQLSLQQWGVLFGMHMLAARTGNRIPYDPTWIAKQFSKQSSPVSKVILNLISTGFLLEFESQPDFKENNEIVFIRDADVALPDPEGEGEGDPDPNISSSRGSASLKGIGADPTEVLGDLDNKNDSLSPPRPDARSMIDDIADQKRTRNSKRRGPGAGNGHDRRNFDDLKASVLDVAIKLKNHDCDQVWKLCCQRLQMSKRQFEIAWAQLREDGEL